MKGLRTLWWVAAVGVLAAVLLVGGCELFQPKVAMDFELSASSGVSPLPVAFTPIVEGDVASSYWDFGDGATSSEGHPVHVYRTAGTYTVTLTVTLEDGSVGTSSKKDCVRVESISHKDRLTLLYWLNEDDGTIYRADRAGMGSEAVVSYIYRGQDLAVGKGFVYWTADTTLHRANEDGTDSKAIATNQTGLYSVSIDVGLDRIYWTCLPSSPIDMRHSYWEGAVKRANLDGSGVSVLKTYDPRDDSFAWWIRADGNGERYYWQLGGYGIVVPRDVRPMSSCDTEFQWTYTHEFSPHLVKGSVCSVYGMALDLSDYPANYIYWTTGSEIRRCRVDGSDTITVLGGLNSAWGIAVDLNEGKMYWSDSAGIHRANLDATEAELIYPGARADVLVIQP